MGKQVLRYGKVKKKKKKRRKEGRKGKEVELLMLAIVFLPGQSISKTCYDIKYPQLSKTTYYLVLAEWLNGVCICLCIWGVTGVTEAGVQAVFALLEGLTELTPLLYAMSWAK